jgi:melibiose permease/lactose/raffinose/galactose permease
LLSGLLIPGSAQIPLFIFLCSGQIFGGFGITSIYLTLVVSFTNTVEYNEYRTGNRQEGLIFSVRPFILQLATAVSQGFAVLWLTLFGLNRLSNHISDLENQAMMGIIESGIKNSEIDKLLGTVGGGEITALLLAITAIPVIILTACCYLYTSFQESEIKKHIKQIYYV